MQLSPVHFQIYSSSTFRRFLCSSPWFPMVPAGSPWLSLVSLGYPWFPLVIISYPWLSLFIAGYLRFKYMWNRLRITRRRLYTHYTHCFLHQRNDFYDSKKCIISNVHYRPGSKRSKFDMTLNRHSPFKKSVVNSQKATTNSKVYFVIKSSF